MGLLVLVSAAWPWEEKLEPEGESVLFSIQSGVWAQQAGDYSQVPGPRSR